MTRTVRTGTYFTLLVAGVLLAAGCGDSKSCASESPTVNKQTNTCSGMAAGQSVQVALQICPTCNQTDAECQVDLSAVSTDGIIHLDPLVHACDTSNSCPPSCDASPLTCTFTSPSAGTYSLYIGASTTPVNFTVGGANTSCAAGPG